MHLPQTLITVMHRQAREQSQPAEPEQSLQSLQWQAASVAAATETAVELGDGRGGCTHITSTGCWFLPMLLLWVMLLSGCAQPRGELDQSNRYWKIEYCGKSSKHTHICTHTNTDTNQTCTVQKGHEIGVTLLSFGIRVLYLNCWRDFARKITAQKRCIWF